jgi:hypothetical protein
MPFDSSVILEVKPPKRVGSQLLLEWTSSAAAGSWYQVYIRSSLAWVGQALNAEIDSPPDGPTRIDIGAVPAAERNTDYSGSLPTVPSNRARLTWLGGPYMDSLIKGFKVYGESSPGNGINYTTELADIPAIEQGIPQDGFGLGAFGDPTFGSIAGQYTWESAALTKGTWAFAVKAYDQAGNLGTVATTTVAIVVAPREVAQDSTGRRLTYTYDFASKKITLNWLASPG